MSAEWLHKQAKWIRMVVIVSGLSSKLMRWFLICYFPFFLYMPPFFFLFVTHKLKSVLSFSSVLKRFSVGIFEAGTYMGFPPEGNILYPTSKKLRTIFEMESKRWKATVRKSQYSCEFTHSIEDEGYHGILSFSHDNIMYYFWHKIN